MRKLFVVLAWLLGIAGFFMLAFAYDALSRRTAQAAGEHAALWIFDPHIAPGGTLHGEIGASRGLALGIRQIRASAAGREVVVRGRGQHWGGRLTTKSTTRGSDDLEFALELPADLPVGESLTITVAVDYAYAQRSMGGFANRSDTEALAVELPVRAPALRLAARAGSGIRALVGFGLLTLLLLRFGPRLTEDDPDASESETEGLAYLMLCVAVFLGMAGYPLFAQPLMAATGLTADGFAVAAMIGWIVGPPLVAWRIHKRRPHRAQWTLRFADSAGRTDPSTVLRLLEMRPELTVRRRRKGFDVRRDRQRTVQCLLAAPDRFEAGARCEATDQDLLFEVVIAIVEKSGPLTLVGPMVELPVDRHSTADGLRDAYLEHVDVALRQMQARIEALKAALPPSMRGDG